MTGPELAELLREANFADRDSLAQALGLADGQPPPRVGRLVQHLSVAKRECWEAIAAAVQTPLPPAELNLDGLCRWEIEQASKLPAPALDIRLVYAGQPRTVVEVLRQNARHTVWHAGQIAALSSGPRLA